jgi:general secretion pathway protein J
VRRDDGFTLVEMLVSLTLLALAAMLMATGLASARGLWSRIEASGARSETVEAAQTLLRDRIERLRPVTLFDQSAPYADIEGERDRLVFTALPIDSERPAAMRRFQLTQQARDLVLEDADGMFPARTLISGVAELEIAYFGPETAGGPAHWQPSWSHQPTPPELVRIRVTFAPGDRRVWPPLIIRPAATVDALCTIAPERDTCRGRSS